MLSIFGDVLTTEGVITGGVVTINNDTIEAVTRDCAVRPRDLTISAPGCLIAPGFVDLHVHGGGNADFMDGTAKSVLQVARTHARFGTTRLLATTLTGSREQLDEAIRSIRNFTESPRPDDCARIEGIHLEGPYICVHKRGAQPREYVRDPDVDEWEHWHELSAGLIKQITMAPELPGAPELIDRCIARGVRVSMGHSDATSAEARSAIALGASQVTHVFNAMRPLHHREPGLLGEALTSAEVFVELIADGVHVDPRIVDLVVRVAGEDRVVLITDAIEGAAMPSGVYRLGGEEVLIASGTAKFSNGTLAGSVLTMNRAFANVIQFAKVSPQSASRMATANALRQLGLSDHCGRVEAGQIADLVVMQPDGRVLATIIGGVIAYRA